MAEQLCKLKKKGCKSGVTFTMMRYQIMSGTGDFYWYLNPPPFKYIKLVAKNTSVSAVAYQLDSGTFTTMTLNTEYDVSNNQGQLGIKLTKINSGSFAYIDVNFYD